MLSRPGPALSVRKTLRVIVAMVNVNAVLKNCIVGSLKLIYQKFGPSLSASLEANADSLMASDDKGCSNAWLWQANVSEYGEKVRSIAGGVQGCWLTFGSIVF